VVDEDGCAEDGGRGPLVVGTYRLLRESVARKASGFYSEGEFDLSRLAGARSGAANCSNWGVRACCPPIAPARRSRCSGAASRTISRSMTSG
jgi:hypothetical protein